MPVSSLTVHGNRTPWHRDAATPGHRTDNVQILFSPGCEQPLRDNDCNEKYVGETGRTLGERHKDHIKSSQSAIYRHAEQTGHSIPSVEEEEVQVLCKESNPIYRKLTEAMYIKYNDPSLNRNIGKADIPDVYDKLLKEEGALSLPNMRNT